MREGLLRLGLASFLDRRPAKAKGTLAFELRKLVSAEELLSAAQIKYPMGVKAKREALVSELRKLRSPGFPWGV